MPKPDQLLVLWRIEDIFSQSLTDWVVESGDPSALVEDVRQLGALVKQAASSVGYPDAGHHATACRCCPGWTRSTPGAASA